MNIYLDIDGVLVGTASPKEDIEFLLKYIIENYPDNTYWLTTHCKNGENHCVDWLRRNGLSDELCDELEKKVKPTSWGVLKTEGIDMDQDFVWFDDNLFESEKLVLEANYVMDGFFKMDPYDPEMAKKALVYLKSLKH